jgi:hypothetical protein
MEDIFLILIGLLWLAYTFYSRSQKKQNRSTRATETETQSQREPSILEQILMGQEISVPEPEEYEFELDETEEEPVYRTQPKIAENKPQPFLSYELNRSTTGMHSAFSGRTTENQPLEIEHLDFFSTPGFLDEEFDLRNAVIYHSVLNTPYIDFK